ncbi:MAG: penicillin acylase family protein, partial [Vulcanimicrobiaceae bacterium]
ESDSIAWGATNGTVESLSVFDAPANLPSSGWRTERFRIRFGTTVTKRYYRSRTLFGVTVHGNRLVLVRWSAYVAPRSPLRAFDGLDRATSMDDALAALRTYTGPPQNFALADTSGRAAYVLAGQIPNDPAWGRYIHPAGDLTQRYPDIPRAQLPHVAPSRTAVVWTANNQMYGPGYPCRLSAQFAPPYRAYRIATLLRARRKYDVRYFASMQMDTLSIPERELAHTLLREAADGTMQTGDPIAQQALRELARWDGRFDPSSHGAGIIAGYRATLLAGLAGGMLHLVHVRHLHGFNAYVASHPQVVQQPWSIAGATLVKHPLAALGITFLNGSTFPGDGDPYTIHVQNQGFSQSFRAVWDVGNWDAGGITIPQGESGWPGSGHYTDEARAWIAGTLLRLPYSDAAVNAAVRERLTLTP